MEKIDDNYPQFIRVDEEKKKNFLQPLVDTPGSLFYKRTQGDIYLIAVSLGFKNKLREKSKKSSDVRTYHGLTDTSKLLIRVVALITENFNYESLKDGTLTLKIVEEYANGGISLLFDKVFHSGTDSSIEDELWIQLKTSDQN